MCLGGMTYVQNFMKTGTDVEVILIFGLRSLKYCNVGISDG
jgi:hypothetical protein